MKTNKKQNKSNVLSAEKTWKVKKKGHKEEKTKQLFCETVGKAKQSKIQCQNQYKNNNIIKYAQLGATTKQCLNYSLNDKSIGPKCLRSMRIQTRETILNQCI